MRRDIFLLILGLLTFATPLLGVPQAWKTTVLFVLGGCVIFISLLYRFEARRRIRAESPHASFAEHDPHETHV